MGFSWKTILVLVVAMVFAMLIYDFVSSKVFNYEEGE